MNTRVTSRARFRPIFQGRARNLRSPQLCYLVLSLVLGFMLSRAHEGFAYQVFSSGVPLTSTERNMQPASITVPVVARAVPSTAWSPQSRPKTAWLNGAFCAALITVVAAQKFRPADVRRGGLRVVERASARHANVIRFGMSDGSYVTEPAEPAWSMHSPCLSDIATAAPTRRFVAESSLPTPFIQEAAGITLGKLISEPCLNSPSPRPCRRIGSARFAGGSRRSCRRGSQTTARRAAAAEHAARRQIGASLLPRSMCMSVVSVASYDPSRVRVKIQNGLRTFVLIRSKQGRRIKSEATSKGAASVSRLSYLRNLIGSLRQDDG